MRGMNTSRVGTKSAPRSCPLLVPDYGEAPTVARQALADRSSGSPSWKECFDKLERLIATAE
jgi:hypothetical protein